MQKKIHIKSYQVVKASMGTYKPFAILVRDEGARGTASGSRQLNAELQNAWP